MMNQSNDNALQIKNPNHILKRTPNSAFSFYSRAQKEFQTTAASPLIINYKFSQEISNAINIEIAYKYRWLNLPEQSIHLQLPSPSMYTKPFKKKSSNFDTPHSTSFFSNIMSFCLEHILQQRPTWQSILSEAESSTSMERHYIQLYFQAYELAATDSERVRTIESLINRYGHYYQYLKSSPDLEHQAIHAQNAMHHYLKTLPSNYAYHSETAQEIHTLYTRIFILLSQQKIHEAWDLFDPYTPLSPFIQKAFPYLQANHHVLHVLFRICGLETHYGPDSVLYIPEHDIIFSIKTHLEKAIELLSDDSNTANFIRIKALNPIQSLLDEGEHIAQKTPVTNIFEHCQQELFTTRQHIMNQSSIPLARNKHANGHDGPIIEEISEENKPTLLLK